MIESPRIIETDVGAANRFLSQLRQHRRSRCRVLGLEELPGEAAKIVNGRWMLHPGNQGSSGFPMGGNTQDRVWSGQFATHFCPTTRILVVLNRVHWTAMSNEKCGHPAIGIRKSFVQFSQCLIQ